MKKSNQRYLRNIVAILAVVLGLLAPPVAPLGRADARDPKVIPVNRQYEKLAAEWWQWVFSFPVSNNPSFDETGEKACLGEEGPGNVFFLAGIINTSGTATRNITVPAGSRLFIPIVNVLWDNIGADPPFTVQQLYEIANRDVAAITELHASIDGQPVPDLFSYRAKSAPFCYTVPATDNVFQFFGFPPEWLAPFACPNGFCVCPAVADGFWLLTNPLPVGEHTINFGGTFGDPINFSGDITYNITVVPGGQYQGCQ